MTGEFIIRLLVAGMLGAFIGLERELRSKEAGLRTHFLVTLGSALIMIVSQWGFQTSMGVAATRGADQARVAAQIVSGIGFLGAGTIIVEKQYVRGLTTAAGLWVSAGIGMAIGGGLYVVGIVSTFLALLSLEMFQFLRSIKSNNITLVLTLSNGEALNTVIAALNEWKFIITDSSVVNSALTMKVSMSLRSRKPHDQARLLQLMQRFDASQVQIERLEKSESI